MKVEDIDVSAAIEKVRVLLNKDKTTSPVLKAAVELIIKILLILLKQKKLVATALNLHLKILIELEKTRKTTKKRERAKKNKEVRTDI